MKNDAGEDDQEPQGKEKGQATTVVDAAGGDDEESAEDCNDEPNVKTDSEQVKIPPAGISISQDEFEALNDDETFKDAIRLVTEQKVHGHDEAAKAKALAYHRLLLRSLS